jgi:carboxypeptidase family protein
MMRGLLWNEDAKLGYWSGIVLFALVAFGLLAISTAMPAAQNAPAKILLQGMVTDSTGKLLTDAQLVVHWDPSGSKRGLTTNVGIPEDRFLKTDTHGTFYAEIPPGFYDILVTAPGFSPECRKIRLKAAQSATLNSKLQLDPLVDEELGNQRP